MEKMDGKTMDIVAENVGKLKELFPEAFTEGKVDFDALKEVLGSFVDDREERYSFTWNGKSKARMIAQTPSTGTLRPCKEESVDWDTTKNIFIEGDNLEVLKLLQKSYHKKVKMIYIDPPYNTGKDFVYKDNFKNNIKNYKEITGQVDGEGRNLSNNPETSGRYHTDWLNMMYPRLKLARNILQDDGAIFISIDDNEVTNLRNMCNEIFGEENFVACLCWQKRYSRENRGAIGDAHEYILVFSKKSNLFAKQSGRIPLSEGQAKVYRNPNDDPKGRWRGIPMTAQGYRPNQMYEIITPSGNTFTPPEGRCWSTVENEYLKLKDEGRIYFGKNDDSQPQIIRYLSEVEGVVPWTWLPHEEGGHTDESKKEMYNIFGKGFEFDTPKPSKLLRHIITICSCEKEFIVLDFFSGSSTTAHATMQLNSEDNGRRKYIMVQLPEPCNLKVESSQNSLKSIAEIGKERIRRATAKLKEENPDYDGDLGFKVFKLDSTNIKPWDVDFDLTERTLEDFISNIKTDRKEEDVLYEILLKYGLDLTLPITKHTIVGQKVFDIGMGALIICLSNDITLEVVEGIARLKDELNPEIMRVVFKDSGFKDDVVKTNAVQILKQAGIIDVRSL